VVAAAAVWAPSAHNTQPWRFSARGQQISLHADASRQLMVADPGGREMMISCGAALFTARLALRSLGYIPDTTVLPDPVQRLLVAQVSWQRRADPAEYEQQLFGWVRQRRTHRGGFAPPPLAPELLIVLQHGAEGDGALLRIITGEGPRAALAAVAETAERAMRRHAAYVQELARWVSPPGSTRADGVPDTAYPARPDRTGPDFPGRDYAHGHGWGLPSFSFGVASSAGVACLLTTAEDRPQDWVHAGQALQRVLLTGAACGVAAALHSQPLTKSGCSGLLCGERLDRVAVVDDQGHIIFPVNFVLDRHMVVFRYGEGTKATLRGQGRPAASEGGLGVLVWHASSVRAWSGPGHLRWYRCPGTVRAREPAWQPGPAPHGGRSGCLPVSERLGPVILDSRRIRAAVGPAGPIPGDAASGLTANQEGEDGRGPDPSPAAIARLPGGTCESWALAGCRGHS